MFGAADIGGSEFSPYFGVLPLILAVIGVWRNWDKAWVKYMAGLGLVAFFNAMGSFSFIHGLLYLFVPYMDKLWEAGRFLFLTHFAMAVLAGFGVQSLFAEDGKSLDWLPPLNRVLRWAVVLVVIALGVPAFLERPEITEWSYLTLFFLLASWGCLLYVARGNRAPLVRFVLVAVIVCDLQAFYWTARNKMHEQESGVDHLEELLSTREVADFFKSQTGLFRVHLDLGPQQGPWAMGDVYGVQTTLGAGASMMFDYLDVLWSPLGSCLFNVRYVLTTALERTEPLVFSSHQWRVHEIAPHCPRAWVLHRAVESSESEVLTRIKKGDFDPMQVAFVNEPLEVALQEPAHRPEQAVFRRYREDGFELEVNVTAAGLLILSEVFYPGWTASVNDAPAHIYKVNGVLRGVVVLPGQNRIVMRYEPSSVHYGILLSVLALFGTFAFAMFVLVRERRENPPRRSGRRQSPRLLSLLRKRVQKAGESDCIPPKPI